MAKDENLEDKPTIPEETDQRNDKNITEESRLFSWEVVKSIVKEFVRAYIRGQIKLPMASIVQEPREYAVTMTDVLKQRTYIKDTICVVAGTKQSTEEEYRKAIANLFEIILIMRLTDSIEGTFLTTDVDNRLTVLEQNLSNINNKQEKSDTLIRKILDYIERNDPYRERKK